MALLKWFWRAAIAVAAGALFAPVIMALVVEPLAGSQRVFAWSWFWDQVFAMIPVMLTPVLVYGLLTRHGSSEADRQSGLHRCGACGHTWKGPPEQFCPQCGRSSMHWAAAWGIALLVGEAAGVSLGWVLIERQFFRPPLTGLDLISGAIMVFLVVSIPISLHALLKRRDVGGWAGRETVCRKCGYILRGITEPRCSECGEKI